MNLNEYLEQLEINKLRFYPKVIEKAIELESIKFYMETMLGVTLNITVEPMTAENGRWLGKGIAESILDMQDIVNSPKSTG